MLIGHAIGHSSALTGICAAVFFYARLAHALFHLSGFTLLMARTVAFTIGWLAFIVFAVALLRAG